MRIEQAVYTSTRSKKGQGYHLVAVSPGISEWESRALSKWGPSHASLLSDEARAESINFHPLTEQSFAVSRTVYGAAEYSGRGGLQVFTRYLILNRQQLSAYDYNTLEFARTAIALGLLRLTIDLDDEPLPSIEIPDRALTQLKTNNAKSRYLSETESLLRQRARVAVIGVRDPVVLLAHLMSCTPAKQRLELSFSTGLKPSLEREFSLQFSPKVTPALSAQFASMGINPVMAS